MLTTFVLEAKENLLTWFRIFISWLFCNQEEIGWKEGILLWHFVLRLHNNNFIYKKMHKNATLLLV